VAVLLLDIAAAVAALHLALLLRAGTALRPDMSEGVWIATPVVAILALGAHLVLGLQPRLWRYVSLRDLLLTAGMALIVAAGSAAALYLAGLAAWMPRSLPAIHWLVMTAIFVGLRVGRRLAADFLRGRLFSPLIDPEAARTSERALFAGCCDRIETLLREYESNPFSGISPAGVLANTDAMPGTKIRGVSVLGVLADLEQVVANAASQGKPIARLIFAEPPDALREGPLLRLIAKAEGLGLKLSCLPPLREGEILQESAAALRPIDLRELLDRRQADLGTEIVEQAIKGRRVLVTGAGGTIGRELVRQVARLGPAELVLLDASEFGLYDVDLEIAETHPDLTRAAVLCSIRQRHQLMQVFAQYQPEIVYHAAALKHVPLVEAHPSAGVQTNVIGTRNVADAANRYGARILVQVSTDKAVNPIGLMGATKRLGELYCQALDIAGSRHNRGARFMTVRFGNVLGSSGSLIPLFQRQLEAGKSLTVTHPDIERYFMTVQEAVQLVLQASARTEGVQRGRVFVLDMGQPIKVLDIAKRMIRLAGKVPDHDVKIEIVGLRPGEKLYEELFNDCEQRLPSVMPGVFEADPRPLPLDILNDAFDRLQMLCAAGEDEAIRKIVFRLLAANDGGDPKVVFEPALAQSRHGIFFTGAAGRGAPVKRPVPANQEA
jgi:FlaA1/EpsC-like NDP-sugar epimerase